MENELPTVRMTSRDAEKKIIDLLMDVEDSTPITKRLERYDISKEDLKDLTSNATFDNDLYDHCRAQILLPAMPRILTSLVGKAAGGSIQATRTYLELLKRLNTKQDLNVNILQYQGLSDAELDRRLESELSRHGIDLNSVTIDGEVIDGA